MREVETEGADEDGFAAEEFGAPGVTSRVRSISNSKSNAEPHLEHADESSEFSVRHCGQITVGLFFPWMPKLWDYRARGACLQVQGARKKDFLHLSEGHDNSSGNYRDFGCRRSCAHG